MRTQSVSPPPHSRSRQAETQTRTKATRNLRGRNDQDPFLEIQAESGRRMRAVISKHYGEIE